MTRFLAFMAAALVAWPAMAAPLVSGPSSPKSAFSVNIVFPVGDTTQSQAIPVSGFCSVRYQQAGGDDASLYAVTTATTAAASGTLIKSFTSSTTAATTFTAGTRWVKAIATDATAGGSVMTIDCAPLTGGGGRGGDPDLDNDGEYDWAVLWDADGDGSVWQTCTAKDVPDPACKAAGERVYVDVADDLNCAIWDCGYGSMELTGTIYLEPGVYVNWPCYDYQQSAGYNARGPANDNLHDSISDAAYLHCPATPDPDTTRRFGAIALMDWQGEIIGAGFDTRNPFTTPNFKRDNGTYLVDDRGAAWFASTNNGNNNWFGIPSFVRGITFGFDATPPVGTDEFFRSGESISDGDSDGSTTISGNQAEADLAGDICVVENAMVTSLQAGDVVIVSGRSGTSTSSATVIAAVRVRDASTTTDCNGAGTATINLGGQVTSGTGTAYATSVPDTITLGSGDYILHARSDFRNTAVRLANMTLEPQDWWNDASGDCQETGLWTVTADGDSTNADIDCDTNPIIGIFGGGSPVIEDVVFKNFAGYAIDGNSNFGEPLIRRTRWFYGQGGIAVDPGSGWNFKDIEIHESQFQNTVTALFGPGVVFDGVKLYNNSFSYFTLLSDINTANVFRNFEFLSNSMSNGWNLTCGARFNEISNIRISGHASQPLQTNGSVARFGCANTADPIYGNAIFDVWIDGIGPGSNGAGLSHAAIVLDSDSVIGTSNAAAIIRNTFRNFHMSMRYNSASSEACLFAAQDDEPTTSRSVGGDFSHNALFGNNTFHQNSVRHFGGGVDLVYCACGQFDAGGNNASAICDDAHTGTAGGGTNPRGCGNFDNNAAPANETCS
jgi:hypothetical protein